MFDLKAYIKDSFVREVLRTINEYSLIDEGDTVIAALSGGADSVALTVTLAALSEEMGFRVVAAHLNHMIRGEEAKRDEDFARKLSDELGVEFNLRYRDIPLLSRGKNAEETGREERYKFFDDLSKKYNGAKIAVAHNLNDVAETVIMRLARGSSVSGLSGIKIKNSNIIRPLLYMKRSDIESFLRRIGACYMTDSTNTQDDYTRNKIRHFIIPVTEKINPEALRAISRTAGKAALAADFIEETVLKEYGPISDRIDIGLFAPLHRAQQEYIASRSAYKAGVKEISDEKISEIIALSAMESGKKILLPGGIRAVKIYKEICFLREDKTVDYETELKEGINYIEEADYTVIVEKCEKGIDLDKTNGRLFARPAREGEVIAPVGMSGTKKIKRLYIDGKLPVTKRERYPVITDKESIIFAYGRADKCFLSDKLTKNAVRIKIAEGDLR